MMIEVMGIMMYEADLEEVLAQAQAEWEVMDEWDRDWYEDYEEYVDSVLHAHLYSEDQTLKGLFY